MLSSFLKAKYGKEYIDIKDPLSFTFTITRPTRGSAIGFWGLPEALRAASRGLTEEVSTRYNRQVSERRVCKRNTTATCYRKTMEV
ncbi:MAG: hypothetical protein CM15mV23_1090 [Eurybiavirus sp.]|nr:MAG: hypothetical protein CM15mV23_1090 [Eurybiavirus sp.]